MTDTLADLLARWAERDSRYSMRKHNGVRAWVTPDEQALIVAVRRAEADTLPGEHRSRALASLSGWTPPVWVGRT